MSYQAEYIWIDGGKPTPMIRCKTKIVADGKEPPIWGFDGSSTNQAPGNLSDCVLRPVLVTPDPLRGGKNKLVLCEVLLTDFTPHPTNTRAPCAEVAGRFADQEPMFGIEQEYTFFQDGRPLGWPEVGFPSPRAPTTAASGPRTSSAGTSSSATRPPVWKRSRVGQAVILLKVHKGSRRTATVADNVAASDDAGTAPVRLTLAQLAALDPVGLPIPVAAADTLELAERMHAINSSRMDQLAEGRVGEVDKTFYRKHLRSAPGNGLALLVRGAHLSPFRVELAEQDPHERWIDASGFTQERHAGRFIQDVRSHRVVQTGIINLEAGRRLVAAIAPPGVYLGNSVNYWVARPRAGFPEEELCGYLLGLLNATVLEWRFRLTSSNHNINLYEVRALPLPSLTDGCSPSHVADFLDHAQDVIRSSPESLLDVVGRIVEGAGVPPRDDQSVARLIGRVAWLRVAERQERRQRFLEAVLDHLISWHLGIAKQTLPACWKFCRRGRLWISLG